MISFKPQAIYQKGITMGPDPYNPQQPAQTPEPQMPTMGQPQQTFPQSQPLPQQTPPIYQSPVGAPPVQGGEDPGKTLAIIGLVLAFVGVQLVGLILSIIGRSKSKKAGFKNTIATVGIWLNAVFLVLGALLIGLYMFLVVFAAVQVGAQDAQSEDLASSIAVKAQEYSAGHEGQYPTAAQLKESGVLSSEESAALVDERQVSLEPGMVGYIVCYSSDFSAASGADIYIYSSLDDSTKQVQALGTCSSY